MNPTNVDLNARSGLRRSLLGYFAAWIVVLVAIVAAWSWIERRASEDIDTSATRQSDLHGRAVAAATAARRRAHRVERSAAARLGAGSLPRPAEPVLRTRAPEPFGARADRPGVAGHRGGASVVPDASGRARRRIAPAPRGPASVQPVERERPCSGRPPPRADRRRPADGIAPVLRAAEERGARPHRVASACPWPYPCRSAGGPGRHGRRCPGRVRLASRPPCRAARPARLRAGCTGRSGRSDRRVRFLGPLAGRLDILVDRHGPAVRPRPIGRTATAPCVGLHQARGSTRAAARPAAPAQR